MALINKVRFDNVLRTSDGKGYRCFDTTVSAEEIHSMLRREDLRYDPDVQRGFKETKDGRHEPLIDKKKVEMWTQALLDNDAFFGQLSWNYRPGESELEFTPYDGDFGSLETTGVAWAPDSWHRMNAIAEAVEIARTRGGNFDPERKFSLRIWNVPKETEARIFYAMNQEGKKADATRSKVLYQSNVGQKLAVAFMKASSHLDGNVGIVRNSVSKNDNKLMAFNTLSTALEGISGDVWVIEESDIGVLVPWLVEYWDRLVKNVPELGRLSLSARQKARRTTIASSAVAVHGFIRLAWYMRKENIDISKLDAFGDQDWFLLSNPAFLDRGLTLKRASSDEAASDEWITRNSRATQRAFTQMLIEKLGI